uniref:Uncharacterized protein n=1 Tax=Rhizophora mucronata TaxID=61149 RepID=A0A2P2QHJ4_RHIMU
MTTNLLFTHYPQIIPTKPLTFDYFISLPIYNIILAIAIQQKRQIY